MVAPFPAIGVVVMEPERQFIVVISAMQQERDQLSIQYTERLKDELMMPIGEVGGAVIASIFVVLLLWVVPKVADAGGPAPVHLQNHVHTDAHGRG